MGSVAIVTNDGFLLSSAPNFRDLGGHRTREGRTVREGLLYRSDALHTLSEPDLTTYNGFGIRQLIDLRTSHERDRLPDVIPDGAEYAAIGVQNAEAAGANFVDLLSDPERARAVFGDGAAERFMFAVYRDLVTEDEALQGYRELVERAAKGPTALVFHCSAGKDRTGWGAALLLTLLGVEREAIVADYLVSNDRQAATDHWMRTISADSGLPWEDIAPMTRVRADYLEKAFTTVDTVYGSFDAYVAEGLGLSQATLEEFADRMLD
ncbi:tyrosine-protein phosphatase [Nocardiopsis alba]|uniref:Protein-tyrosine-phosphatase n=1 Tax=Nocardiopsis alba TaxID=53437 RepID=A0A7K2ING4_9ACTN|nr:MULTISPECIES: tyrosine-protein phosphatase [Nocardiopsis]MEC3893899.1 tyrosine-protein phosphatase [Nocardiopsis sp. LDBS1602]MYR31520.1 protein-tyrosine-phosphatase [Nocardiopsis alba]